MEPRLCINNVFKGEAYFNRMERARERERERERERACCISPAFIFLAVLAFCLLIYP